MEFNTPINICSVDYEVVLKTTTEMPSAYGECHSGIQQIWLSNSNTEETQKNTLLHECLHAISDAYMLELSERQVNVLATALIDFARHNKEYTNYFFNNHD